MRRGGSVTLQGSQRKSPKDARLPDDNEFLGQLVAVLPKPSAEAKARLSFLRDVVPRRP